MSNFACEHCGSVISDTNGGYVTGCSHYPLEGHGEWKLLTDAPPDFREYGFHTGRLVQARLVDGREVVTQYQGYELFGHAGYESGELFDDVTHWRPNA